MLTLTVIANILVFGLIGVALAPIVVLVVYAVGRLSWEILRLLVGDWV